MKEEEENIDRARFIRYLKNGIITYVLLLVINIFIYLLYTSLSLIFIFVSSFILTVIATYVSYKLVKLISKSEQNKKEIDNLSNELTNNSKLNIIQVNRENIIYYANKSFCELTGFNMSEIIDSNIFELLNITPINILNPLEKTHKDIKLHIKSKDGISIPILYNSICKKADEIFIYIIDISKSHNLEVTLRNSLIEYNGLFNNSSVCFIQLDREHSVLKVNNTTLELLGYTTKELKRKNINSILADNRINREKLRSLFSSSTIPNQTIEIIKKSGKLIWALISVNKFEDGYTMSLQDITDTVEAGIEAEKNNEQINFVLNSAELAIWSVDLKQNKVITNKLWYDRLGYSRDEIDPIEKSWYKIIHKDDLDKVIKDFRYHVKNKPHTFSSIHRYRQKDGNYAWMRETSTASEIDKNGEVITTIGIQEDISKKKEEEFLRSLTAEISNKLIGITSSNIESVIKSVLEKLGNISNSDLIYIYQLEEDQISFTQTHYWVRDTDLDSIRKNHIVNLKDHKWAGSQLLNKKAVIVNNINDIPKTEVNTIKLCHNQNSKSILLIPLILDDITVSFLGFSTRDRATVWQNDYINTIQLIGNLIVRSIENIKNSKQLKETAEKLEKNRKKIKNIHKIADVARWSYDIEQKTFKFSDNLFKLIDLTKNHKTVTLAKLKEISDEKYINKNAIHFSKKAIGEFSIVHKIYTRDCREKYFEIFFQNTQSPKNDNILNGIAIDVTKSRLSNKILKISNKKYSEIFEKNGHAICTFKRDNTIVKVNSLFCKTVGLPKQDLENKIKWTDFLVTEDSKKTENLYDELQNICEDKLITHTLTFKTINNKSTRLLCTINLLSSSNISIATFVKVEEIKENIYSLYKF